MAPVFSKPLLPFPDDTLTVRYIHSQADAQAELDRLKTRRKELNAKRKERLCTDPEYREREEEKKRRRIENDPLRLNARKHADTVARLRRLAKEAQEALSAQERGDMIEKVQLRYFLSKFSH